MTPRIIAVSDLHGTLPEIPHCDILVIGGDVCPSWDHNVGFQLQWLDVVFREWLERQPAKFVVGIAGNHDFVFERWSDKVSDLKLPWVYLQDSGTNLLEVNFWGVPWVPNLSRWAFHGQDDFLDERFSWVPAGTDVVISHGPPHGYCDKTVPQFGGVSAGFPGTNDMLNRVKPKALICGHIHEGYGSREHPSGALVYNVSLMNENYHAVNAPVSLTDL